jgi:phosphomannomutase/phosphoglucomutase
MDLKTKLEYITRLSVKKQADKRLVYSLGLFGVLIIVVTCWLTYSDWRSGQAASESAIEGRRAIEQLTQPIQSLKRVLTNEQVQNLAVRAVENPETLSDLFAYLNGRMSQISEVSVFSTDLSDVQVSDLGPNGFAVFDMVQSALRGNQSLLQVHGVFKPPRMFDAVTIKSGGDIAGVMVVNLDPEYLLSTFNPEYSSLGFIRLSQYNGRQPPSKLKEFGDASLLGEIPERLPVPGSLFRIEFPMQKYVELIGSGVLILMLLAGVLCLSVSIVLLRGSQKKVLEPADSGAGEMPSGALAPPGLPGDANEPAPSAMLVADPAIESDPEEPAQAGALPVSGEDIESEAPPAEQEPSGLHLHYDIAERRRLKEAEHTPVELGPEIFRAYDIRGVIDKTLDSGVARSVGRAVGTVALEKKAGPVVVARDGRLSGPYLMKGMIDGILSTGCDVLDIGAVPTGVLYYAAHEMAEGSGVMITGSHNPPDYNGFKVMIAGDTLHGETISDLYRRIKSGDLDDGTGSVTRKNVVPDYIKRIAGDISVDRELKIVIDCGNGIGGVCAADTLRAIGVEVLPLFDEVDGTFPNHHPDPSDPENLNDLIESVRLMDADLGLAFDGDADRLGVVTLAGNIIYPDRVMMLLAMDVLDRNPGATIIYDVKCTGHLPAVIREAGGNPVMYKTGHSLIKAKMKEIGSPFAGEMSGHFFFGERWYGVDDGIYAAARLLEILGSTDTPPEAILNALPTSYSTPELKVHMEEGENHDFIEAFRAVAKFEGAEISTIDGLRADFSDGWGLVRASNTTPILVVRFDAETEEALARIKEVFRAQMLGLKADLELPF